MNRLLYIMLLLAATPYTHAQKPGIDTSAIYGNWPSVRGALISNDGNYASYSIDNSPMGNNTFIVKSVSGNWEKEFTGAAGKFTSNSKEVVIKFPGDSLCIWELGTNQQSYITHVSEYALSGGKEEWLAYLLNNPEKELVLKNLSAEKELRFSAVHTFSFNKTGNVLLMQAVAKKEDGEIKKVEWLDVEDQKLTTIWQGEGMPLKYTFNAAGNEVAFLVKGAAENHSGDALWCFKKEEKEAKMLVNEESVGANSNLILSNEPLNFSKDGSRIFFKLIEKSVPQAAPEAVKVDIWNYKDDGLQSNQLTASGLAPRLYAAVVNTKDAHLIRLQGDQDCLFEDQNNFNEYVKLVAVDNGGNADYSEWWWNEKTRPSLYFVDARDGSRKLVQRHAKMYFIIGFSSFSPDGRYWVYYDGEEQSYCSYDRENGITRNLIKGASVRWVEESSGISGSLTPGLLGPILLPVGIAGWREDGSILIYDEYDVWLFDPAGKKPPTNLTRGYGRSHHIRFRLADDGNVKEGFIAGPQLLLSAFNEENKYSGFYYQRMDGRSEPALLSMGAWAGTSFLKARDADVWIGKHQSAVEYPNYFMTKDLKTYTALSDLQPQRKYNWLHAELVHWKTFDGTASTGILYKPENFDSTKKYPVLFTYYEKKSDEIYGLFFEFMEPYLTTSYINIPYFVSHGYLVFVPDIHYKIGIPGESVVNCVVSAAKYLGKLPYVDAKKMGINGQSFGGYETNYLVTHTHCFAAAAEMAGPTDIISAYGSVRLGDGRGLGMGNQYHCEIDQGRIGASLWQRPDLYIKNSPIFKANEATTPFLMIHSIGDDNVPFEQSLELYLALRRLGKKVWMLQYDNGNHIIGQEKDAKDLTIRLTQFFDYYLKDAPPPKWMTEGVPARLKGIETGLGLDTSGKIP